MVNPINNAHQETPIPSNNNRASFNRRMSSFFSIFSNIGRWFSPSTLTGRAHQIQLERNLQQALAHWTEVVLDQWVEEGGPQENRAQAKRIIKVFLSNPTRRSLSLSNLRISTLPNIWDHPAFIERLQILDLFNNQFQTLPESIGQLAALTHLYLSNNQLQALPESIGQLAALEILDLLGNQLQALPESISQLTALTDLDLLGNQLQALPDSIRQLTGLRKLSLSNNHLRVLPDSIGQLTALTDLDLSCNRFQVIPESIGRLRALTHLFLSFNWSLTSLPQNILSLPSSCEIDLENCGLSAQVLRRLREQCTAPGYNGPRIRFSMENTEARTIDTRTVDELLDSLYQIAGKTRIPFSKEFTSSPELRDWLSRIFYMADFNANQGAKRVGIAQKVLNVLELAADPNHREFHDVFLGTIASATRSCGDSMSLSLLHLGIARKLTLVDPNDLQSLATLLLRGSWTLSQLEEFARSKVRSLRFVDEIEVYLGYPIMLKDRLAIPIDVDEMLYFRCSGLNKEDLQIAEDTIRSTLQDKEKVCDFLSSNDTWVKALDRLRLLVELKAERAAKKENSSSFEEDAAIATAYKQKLADLTEEQLRSFGYPFRDLRE